MKRLLLSAFTVLMLLGCGERKQASDSSNEGTNTSQQAENNSKKDGVQK